MPCLWMVEIECVIGVMSNIGIVPLRRRWQAEKTRLIEKLSKTILEQLREISNYISQVRAELRRQHPETRESWLKGEMDSMNHKTSHLGKPSVKDCCKYLNLAVSDKKEILAQNLVEKLMSEIGHVTCKSFVCL